MRHDPARRAHWALVGGAATGFGLAVGMEALPFEAVVGASYALRLAWDEGEAEAGRNYGAALAASTIGFFLLQTPPMRWGSPPATPWASTSSRRSPSPALVSRCWRLSPAACRDRLGWPVSRAWGWPSRLSI